MSKKRTYEKGAPTLDLRPIAAAQEPVTTAVAITLPEVSSRFKKGESLLQPNVFLVIISGGERREKDYFALLDKADRFFPNIKVAFNADPKRLDPDGMWEFYEEVHEQYRHSESADVPDHYYLLSDVDHFTNPLLRIKPLCEQQQVSLIVSNPCFEVWLYYSERSDRFVGFRIPDNQLEISSAVKTFLNEQIPGGVNPQTALLKLEQNIRNSVQNYTEQPDGLPGLFATNMHVLAADIQPYVDSGILQYNKWREEQRQRFKE